MRRAAYKAFDRYCRWRISRTLPGAIEQIAAYARTSDTTGTQWITLWLVVKGILKHRPNEILESGTGSSTLVLAAAVRKLKDEVPGYTGRITSMESVPEWHAIATKNLPAELHDTVEIILGPRERFDVGFFRGFIHSNIPARDYDFILLDGPAFADENGLAFCADVFKAMDLSSAPVIHGVVDGRASSVFVIQTLFGVGAARYYHSLYAATFSVPRINFRDANNRTPKDWFCTPFGRLIYRKFR